MKNECALLLPFIVPWRMRSVETNWENGI